MSLNKEQLGQVFTPENLVNKMLELRKNTGRVLEPSCGNGAFFNKIPGCIGIELDPEHCPATALNQDFFSYPLKEKFETIIGNPPYVRYQDILPETKSFLTSGLFDKRSNLYLFFIEKAIKHLTDHGELIFIVPRDLLYATSARKLNTWLYTQGTITDFFTLGDSPGFQNAIVNCIIFRFEKDNFNRVTNQNQFFTVENGQMFFTEQINPSQKLKFSDLFFVKVGAVSGNDQKYITESAQGVDFVCSQTNKTGQLRKMIYDPKTWIRKQYQSLLPRIYVNTKTRNPAPFFLSDCLNWDGAILAIFPKFSVTAEELKHLTLLLNTTVDWSTQGCQCDGRFLFGQRLLENCFLPQDFLPYKDKLKTFRFGFKS